MSALAGAQGMSSWTVYILHCADDSYYTGITTDVQRRLTEHNHSNQLAAKYVRGRRPVTLVYQEPGLSQSAARKREYVLKQLPRDLKERLIQSNGPDSLITQPDSST